VNFAKPNNEMTRLVLLLGITAVVELFVLPRFSTELLEQSSQWPMAAHLLAISAPRLVLTAILVALLGPFLRRSSIGVFVAVYGLLLFARFWQTEVYVDWENTVAATRAIVPYVAGLLGALVGFGARRRPMVGTEVRP
jgi:hypothetical protein